MPIPSAYGTQKVRRPMPPQSRPKPSMRLGTVVDLVLENPGLSEPAARALIARRESNGLAEHIYHIGRRVLVDLDGFHQWVRQVNGRAAA